MCLFEFGKINAVCQKLQIVSFARPAGAQDDHIGIVRLIENGAVIEGRVFLFSGIGDIHLLAAGRWKSVPTGTVRRCSHPLCVCGRV